MFRFIFPSQLQTKRQNAKYTWTLIGAAHRLFSLYLNVNCIYCVFLSFGFFFALFRIDQSKNIRYEKSFLMNFLFCCWIFHFWVQKPRKLCIFTRWHITIWRIMSYLILQTTFDWFQWVISHQKRIYVWHLLFCRIVKRIDNIVAGGEDK